MLICYSIYYINSNLLLSTTIFLDHAQQLASWLNSLPNAGGSRSVYATIGGGEIESEELLSRKMLP